MSSRPANRTRLAPRLLAAALAGLLAACPAGGPGQPVKPKASGKPATSTKPSAKPSPTPEVLPSLGLLLSGEVAVDPTRLLEKGVATRVGNDGGLIGKVKLIGDAGSGLISDSGLGLIGDAGSGLIGNNAGNLISDAGSGLIGKVKLIGDAGSGLIGNNSAGLIGKVKFDVLQASEATAVPVQGIVVFAVRLSDGKVVAGPIRTNEEGQWRLGFVEAPTDNLRIMAQVYGRATDPDLNYATLSTPSQTAVDLTDATRAVSIFLIQIMRARVQDALEARKRGEEFKIWYVGPSSAESTAFFEAMNGSIGIMTPNVAVRVDRNGQGALTFAEKILSFADLSKPIYQDLHAISQEIRAYGDTLGPGKGAALMDDYVALTAQRSPVAKLPELLQGYGMPEPRIQDLTRRYGLVGDQVFLDLAAVAKDNMGAVLEAFFTAEEPSPTP